MNLGVETIVKLNKFKPRPYQIPVMDALENKGYKKVLAIWPRRCLSGLSWIIMADGTFKELMNIRVDDKILSFDGKSYVTDVVKGIFKTEVKPSMAVMSDRGKPIITSYDHKFACVSHSDSKTMRFKNRQYQSSEEIQWIKASELDPEKHQILFRKRKFDTPIKTKFDVCDNSQEVMYDIETYKYHNFFANGYLAVSYTHLTLPTICSV